MGMIILIAVIMFLGIGVPVLQYPLLAYIAYRLTKPDNGNKRIHMLRFAIACSVIAAASLLIPLAMNREIERRAEALRASDKPFIGSPLSGGTLAMINGGDSFENAKEAKPPRCDTYCRKFLFNGTFARVLMGDMERGFDAQIPQNGLVGYRIERRNVCPPFSMEKGSHQDDDGNYEENNIVKARMAAGECIVSEPASLSEADIALVQKRMPGDEIRWPPHALGQSDTERSIRVWRRTEVYDQRKRNKELLARITPVETSTAKLPLLVGLKGGYQLQFSFGVLYDLRLDEYDDTQKLFPAIFGDGMKPPAPGDHLQARAGLEKALADTSTPADDPRLRAASGVLETIGKMTQKDDKDLPLLRAIITDRRLGGQDLRYLYSALRGFGPEQSRLLAEALIQELEASLGIKEPVRMSSTHELLSVLPALPQEAMHGFTDRVYAVLEKSMLFDFRPEALYGLFLSLTANDEGIQKLASLVINPDILLQNVKAGSKTVWFRGMLQQNALQALDHLPPQTLETLKPQLIEGLRRWLDQKGYVTNDGDICSPSYPYGTSMGEAFTYLVTVLVRMGESETVKHILSACPRGLANIPDAEAARTRKFRW